MAHRSKSAFEKLHLGVLDKSRGCMAAVQAAATMCGIGNVHALSTEEDVTDFITAGSPNNVFVLHAEEPFETALALCRAIRNRDTSPAPFLPIIIVSRHATKRHVQMARDAGADEFLVSPFSTKAFTERISAVVFHRRGFVEIKGYFGPCRRRGAMAKALGAERRSAPTRLIDPRTERVYLG